MVWIDFCSIQLDDEDVVLIDVNLEYYCHDFLKPSEMNPLHVVFGLKGIKENPLNVAL
jgi:hypothetical protein